MSVGRIVVALLAGLVATLASAATITERSPFAQGQWWDPSRSGHGFEILSVRDQVAIVWFTYDDRGRPVWYTANGRLDALGTEALPLMRHRWENGAKGGADVVGSLRLTLRSFEAADVAFEVDGRRGTWQIQPLVVSGVIPEIDHSGLWFDAGNSGWGVSLTQQGDVLGGLLYTYDAAGAPTWVAGWTRDSPDVAFRAYSGTCPTCAWREATSTGVGQLSFDLRSEAEMTMRSGLALGMASGIRLDGARISQLGRPASWRSADRQLARFDTACGEAQREQGGEFRHAKLRRL